jgi:hypothetical protein
MSKYVLVADITQLPGSLTIGDDPASDTLGVNALLTTDLVPDGDLTRKLGSPSAQWKVYGTVTDGVVETHSGRFQHTVSGGGGAGDAIDVFDYVAADFVGGTMKVHLAEQGTNNSGIAEYLFLNNTDAGGTGGSIEITDRRNLNTQTIDNNQDAAVVGADVHLYIQHTLNSNGTILDGVYSVELLRK